MVIEIIQREIPVNGIGYLILRDCPEDRLDDGLKKGMERLKKAGAKTVWATSLPEGEPLHPGPVGIWQLTHVHDMVRMERSLPAEKPEHKLNLRSPKKGQEEGLYRIADPLEGWQAVEPERFWQSFAAMGGRAVVIE